MKCFIVFAVVLCSVCGCRTMDQEPLSVIPGISSGMPREEFLEAIPRDVEVVQEGKDFVTVRYPVSGPEEWRVAHFWFLDGGLKNVPSQ